MQRAAHHLPDAKVKLSLTVLIWAGIALSCSGLIGFAAWTTWKSYEQTTEAAVAHSQNLVRILRQHTERTFDSVDIVLKMVARELGPDSADPLTRSLALDGLAYLTQDLPHVLSVRLLDGKTAQPLFEFVRSREVGRDADLDAQRAHASARYLGLHVGKPLHDPVSGNRLVGISRRITGREGTPGHVVIAHVSLDYLQEFYDGVDVGALGSVSVIRLDGIQLARRPFDPANIGRDISPSPLFKTELPRRNAGTYETVAVNDGIARIFSYQRLEKVPIVITVGVAKSELLASWLHDAQRDASLAAIAVLLLIAVGGVLSREVRRRDSAEIALLQSEERLRLALQAAGMLAWELDPETGFVTQSENAQQVLGLGSEPLQNYLRHVVREDRRKVVAAINSSLDGQMRMVECRYVRPTGEVMWLELRAVGMAAAGAAPRIVGTAYDITARKTTEQQIWWAANHDGLTGLANRRLFQARLEAALRDHDETAGLRITLLLLDLDDFKAVNDTLGHDAGDALLREAAARLTGLVRKYDTVARLGGDEFAVLLVDAPSLQESLAVAERILHEMARVFTFRDRPVTTRVSIGIAAYPDHHSTPAELMKDADMALYAAKAQGKNRLVVYCPSMRAATEERFLVATEIRQAIADEQLVPFYQPKVCLTTNRVVGLEALARWKHPLRGVLTPGTFGSAFEDPELATSIAVAMLHQILADTRDWLDRGLDFGRVAINLSPSELSEPDCADIVLQLLSQYGVPAKNFEVEVTENVLLGRTAEQVGTILRRFHNENVAIALDDFGTGYASLSHLKQYPVDLIKIDRSFVRDLERDPDDAAIVSAVIGLGKSLGIKVVAEGVETSGQSQYLRERGCDQAQGYLFSRPLAASRIPWLLTEGIRPTEPIAKTPSNRKAG